MKTKYVVKLPTLEQAKAICASGKHPYSHPCAGCGKACSTPTKPFWLKRVKDLGSIENVYKQYKCRDCRKQGKPKQVKGISQPVGTLPDVEVIPKLALCRMPSGVVDYFWKHPLYNLPSGERKMVETGCGYGTYVRTMPGETTY
jgi:hypothetical protein